MGKWLDRVTNALQTLGGEEHLSKIYSTIKEGFPEDLPKNWKAIIRKELEYNSPDSTNFQGSSPLFYSAKGIGKGVWGINPTVLKWQLNRDLPHYPNHLINDAGPLEEWEARLIKSLIHHFSYNNQQALALFSLPNRDINPARIIEIKSGKTFVEVEAAPPEETARFLEVWPNLNWANGDFGPWLKRATEAHEMMLDALQAYNNPRGKRRHSTFLVLSNIAWTYLLHSFYERNNIKFVYKEGKYWDLEQCVKSGHGPLSEPEKANLQVLIELRNSVVHSLPDESYDSFVAEFLATCINFNSRIVEWFGQMFRMEEAMGIALQFTEFDHEQLAGLKKSRGLVSEPHIAVRKYIDSLDESVVTDPKYALRYGFFPVTKSKPSQTDKAFYFLSDTPKDLDQVSVLFKEIEKKKYSAGEIVILMNDAGYPRFKMHNFIKLWQERDAKNPNKNYAVNLYSSQWMWYENWVEETRTFCQTNASLFD